MKNLHRINHISLDRNHCWQRDFPVLLPGLTKRKNCQHKNSVLQHSFISNLLSIKASQYLLKTFRKKFRFLRNLKQRSKPTQTTRSQGFKSIIKAQNKILLFCYPKFILWFKKLLDTGIDLLSIEGTIWSLWKKDRVLNPIDPFPRCTPLLIQSPIW